MNFKYINLNVYYLKIITTLFQHLFKYSYFDLHSLLNFVELDGRLCIYKYFLQEISLYGVYITT